MPDKKYELSEEQIGAIVEAEKGRSIVAEWAPECVQEFIRAVAAAEHEATLKEVGEWLEYKWASYLQVISYIIPRETMDGHIKVLKSGQLSQEKVK